MNQLEVENKTLTSIEVAEMVDKEHHKLLRDIRVYVDHLAQSKIGYTEHLGQSKIGYTEDLGELKIAPTDFFLESSYKTNQNKEQPCYLITKKGCEFIANKLTGVKGTLFTATYINKFNEMEKGLIKPQVSFKEQVECIAVIGDILRVNDASRLYMINELYKSYSLPTGFLPQYVSNGNRDMKSATELLKRFELGISTKSFNILLKTNGFLEERTRRSTKDETKSKKYNALTDKGLKYGENLISPHSQREVQPMYYTETFEELYKMVV